MTNGANRVCERSVMREGRMSEIMTNKLPNTKLRGSQQDYKYFGLYIHARPTSLAPCATFASNYQYTEGGQDNKKTHRSSIPPRRFLLVLLTAFAVGETEGIVLLRIDVSELCCCLEVALFRVRQATVMPWTCMLSRRSTYHTQLLVFDNAPTSEEALPHFVDGKNQLIL